MEIICLDCGAKIRLDAELVVGDLVECENCGTEMEIVSLNPPKVRVIEEEK